MINPNRTRRSDLEKNRDYLTNAHSRNHMIDKLKELIGKKSWFHLYCVDVDSFRKANRLKGFQLGDALLINLFQNLCALCPASVIFRSHGDQFFMIIEEPHKKTLLDFPDCFDCQGYNYTVSSGLARYPESASTWKDLILYSEFAKEKAKVSKGNSLLTYEDINLEKHELHDYVEKHIHHFLKENWFYLLFQPIISVTEKKIEGYEVLMRWNDPIYGVISPNVFIPIAEDSGMIIPLTKKLLCECKRILLSSPCYFESRYLAINISMIDLISDGFIPFLADLFQEDEALLAKLEFEITETYCFKNFDLLKEKFQQLQSLGIKISIDDFGTGFSSFEKLANLNFNRIKIDQVFIRNLPDSENDLLILHSIASLAKSMSLKTTVEGVMNHHQQACLNQFCFNSYQGYYFAKPLPLNEALSVRAEDIERKCKLRSKK